MQVYALTAVATNEVIDNFYGELKETMDWLPKKDIVMVMGELNAKVGKGSHGSVIDHNELGDRNEAGDRLLGFGVSNDLVISNTCFTQPPCRLYMWSSPDEKHRSQIDFIMIKRRWRSVVQSATTRPGADCG